MTEPVVALVVAAGSGVRLGADRPKALVELAGTSLVRRSVDALVAGGVTHVVVVGPHSHQDDIAAALDGLQVPVLVASGGDRRQDSVRSGLEQARAWPLAAGHRVILVHDAARPLVPAEVVAGVIDEVRGGALAVVPAIEVVDSIRRLTGASSAVVDRADLRAVQTPQGFDSDTLWRAHEHLVASGAEVTDDAAACEMLSVSVHLVPGSGDALKITTALDLVLASALVDQRKA